VAQALEQLISRLDTATGAQQQLDLQTGVGLEGSKMTALESGDGGGGGGGDGGVSTPPSRERAARRGGSMYNIERRIVDGKERNCKIVKHLLYCYDECQISSTFDVTKVRALHCAIVPAMQRAAHHCLQH
jgi:hypothetical protein